MKKGRISNVVLVVIFLAGLSLLLYPFVSDYYNSFHQSQAITNYAENIAVMNESEYEELWRSAVVYNESLKGRNNVFALSEEEYREYKSLLDFLGTGIMGYIEIPVINCSLPVYHGTAESVLQIAVGHLEWTSLPTGGEGTHCVLSGHRGLPSAKLFSELDKMVLGDIFMIRVLNEVLTYEVDQILIVNPWEVDALQIVEGMDYCTLVTCTPYGVNSHRILVRGHRIENIEEKVVRVTSDAIQIEPLIVAPVVASPILVLFSAYAQKQFKVITKVSKTDNAMFKKFFFIIWCSL